MAIYCTVESIVDQLVLRRLGDAKRLLNEAWKFLDPDNTGYCSWEVGSALGMSPDPIPVTDSIAKPKLSDIERHNGSDIKIARDGNGDVVGVWMRLYRNNIFVAVRKGNVFTKDGLLRHGYSTDLQLGPTINSETVSITD